MWTYDENVPNSIAGKNYKHHCSQLNTVESNWASWSWLKSSLTLYVSQVVGVLKQMAYLQYQSSEIFLAGYALPFVTQRHILSFKIM